MIEETCKGCLNLVSVNKHPCNGGTGRVTDHMGFVCVVGLKMGGKEAFFIDSDQTTACELLELEPK